MIKVVALSCAGTVTYREPRKGKHAFEEPFRYGFKDFIGGCRERGIEVVFTSRHPSWRVQNELVAHVRGNPPDNGWFRMGEMVAGFYTADGTPKDFSRVLDEQNIAPEELLVVGSNMDRDITGARNAGANFQIVRPYVSPLDWGRLGYGLEGFASIIDKHSRSFGELEPRVERRVTSSGLQLPVAAAMA